MSYRTEHGIRWTEKARGLYPSTGLLSNSPAPRSLEQVNAGRMAKIGRPAHSVTEHNPLGVYIPADELARAVPVTISGRTWCAVLGLAAAIGAGLAMLLPSP